MPTWRQIVMAMAALILMRWGGLISSTWAALGLLGFVLILTLLQYLPAFKRLATAVFVLWVLFSFGLPALGAAFRTDWPILGETLTDAAISSELTAAEWRDPVALQARIGARRFCREVDRVQGVWLSQRFDELQREVAAAAGTSAITSLPLPPEARSRQLLKWVETIEEQRLQCRAAVLRESGEGGAAAQRSWFPASRRLLLMLVAFGLVAAIVVAAVLNAKQKKPFVGLVVLAAAVLLAWLAADSYFGDKGAVTAPFSVGRGGFSDGAITVNLKGPGGWVDVSDELPGCTRVVFKSHRARNPYVRLGRGAPQPLRGGREFGRLAYPIEVAGDGEIVLELHDIGRQCS